MDGRSDIPIYRYRTRTLTLTRTRTSSSSSGWWFSHPSEKYELVSWDYEIPNFSWKVIKFHGSSHHQPAISMGISMGMGQ
jgi:hypothetical protein